jgi:hypothetical protein
VTCRVKLIAGGKVVKTVRRKLTLAAALRELGGDPVGNEGRLITGCPLMLKRSIVRGRLRVEVIYRCDPRPESHSYPDQKPQVIDLDTQSAVRVARAGGAF